MGRNAPEVYVEPADGLRIDVRPDKAEHRPGEEGKIRFEVRDAAGNPTAAALGVIVVDEGYGRYGVTAEIASVIAEGAFFDLEAPVKRIGAMHVPIPFSPPLEDATVPNEQTVFEAAKALCGR